MLLGLGGCAFQRYRPEPLAAADDRAVRDERRAAANEFDDASADTDGFRALVALLRTRNPDVQAALARYRTLAARADIDTPWPNPTLSFGPRIGFDTTDSSNVVVPFVGLMLTLPLSGRLARQDDVHRAAAAAALVDALAAFRERGLELRTAFCRAVAGSLRVELGIELMSAADAVEDAVERAVAAGTLGSVEVTQYRLETAREAVRLVGARRSAAEARADLAALVALPPDAFDEALRTELPPVPAELPPFDELLELVFAENPRLARLRAEHELSERRLHLEIARQFPDLTFGPNFGGEPGEELKILGLPLGFQVPLFARNQQEVAAARASRDERRVAYVSEAERVLTQLERALTTTRLAVDERRILAEEVAPAADAHLAATQHAVEAGFADALQLLDAERSWRAVQVELLEARLQEVLAWTRLERAVGYPLFTLADGHADVHADATSAPESELGTAASPTTDDQ
ncbi:MAG: TolC family protein [Planctomycetota bacterium]